jgi:hypothetical protein
MATPRKTATTFRVALFSCARIALRGSSSPTGSEPSSPCAHPSRPASCPSTAAARGRQRRGSCAWSLAAPMRSDTPETAAHRASALVGLSVFRAGGNEIVSEFLRGQSAGVVEHAGDPTTSRHPGRGVGRQVGPVDVSSTRRIAGRCGLLDHAWSKSSAPVRSVVSVCHKQPPSADTRILALARQGVLS